CAPVGDSHSSTVYAHASSPLPAVAAASASSRQRSGAAADGQVATSSAGVVVSWRSLLPQPATTSRTRLRRGDIDPLARLRRGELDALALRGFDADGRLGGDHACGVDRDDVLAGLELEHARCIV